VERIDKLGDTLQAETALAMQERGRLGGNLTRLEERVAGLGAAAGRAQNRARGHAGRVEHLQTAMAVLSNSSQQVAALVHARLDSVEDAGQDLTIEHAGLRENVMARLGVLRVGLEAVQGELEREGPAREERLGLLEQQVVGLTRALNNSFANWAELKVIRATQSS
jgi:hypothetical protein